MGAGGSQGDAKRPRDDDEDPQTEGRSTSAGPGQMAASTRRMSTLQVFAAGVTSSMAQMPGAAARVTSFRNLRSDSHRNRIQPANLPDIDRRESMKSYAEVDESSVDEQTRAFLSSVMNKHFIFATMEAPARDPVIAAMKKKQVQQGSVVFDQGDVGDSCYFIRSGTFAVRIDGVEVKKLGANDSFGELALLYQMKRSATITCVLPGELWRMDQTHFRRCMESLSSTATTRALAFFRCDPNFCNVRESEQRILASKCSTQHFTDGEVIMREGEVGEWMFILLSGRAVPSDDRLTEHFDRPGAIIGAVALVYGKRQATGFTAKGNVTCLALAKSSLMGLDDHLNDVLRRCAVKALLHCLPRSPGHRPIFSVLTDDQQHRLIGAAEDGCFEPGEVIACPGDPAQLLVVIDGEVAIVPHLADALEERSSSDGVLLFVNPGTDVRGMAERILTDGMGYGEEPELLNNQPISRYVVSVGRCRLHRISHAAVLKSVGIPLLEAVRVEEIKRVLTDIFLFKNLREDQVERTVRRLEQQTFAAGEIIVQQDDPARHFFLIQRGTICVKIGSSVVRTLGRWDYFGERGLLLQERRSATCQALEECACLVLDADVFFDIVGMFRKELERRMHLQDLNIKMSDLKCKAVVGRGTFGVVRLVHPQSKENTMYALKCVTKMQVVKNNQERAILMEKEVNAQCYHPCIVQFIKTFQDKHNVYFLTEFLGGGDLFVAIRRIGVLTKLQAQFFSGCITLGIEYLHARGIMYRDLKPENVLLDFQGYAKLVDFGCCKKEFRTSTLIGTPEYLAPEVIKGAGYTCVVDWWSLGIMMYEFIVGPLPFGGDCEDNSQIFRAILEAELLFPDTLTDPSANSIIEGLLNRTPQRRLAAGRRGAKEIKEHIYFLGFNWDALAGGFLVPPWKPDQEALMQQWEPPDGDLMNHVSREQFSFPKGMEWARDF